jgi:hypothetical protein
MNRTNGIIPNPNINTNSKFLLFLNQRLTELTRKAAKTPLEIDLLQFKLELNHRIYEAGN